MHKTTTAIIIAFANQKGGVGKTTSVSTCGGILANKGKKIILTCFLAQIAWQRLIH